MDQKPENSLKYIYICIALASLALMGVFYLAYQYRNPKKPNAETSTAKPSLASVNSDGYLSALDWAKFNSKQDSLGFTPISNTTTVNGQALSSSVVLWTSDIQEAGDKHYISNSLLTNLTNQSGTNTGDETRTTIMNKLGAATATTDGYITALDWGRFNTDLDTVAIGTTSQYLRGDRTWATLNQSAVSGLTTGSSPAFAGLTIADAVLVNDGNANAKLRLGALPSSPGSFAGLWFGQTTPNDANYTILGDSTNTYINTPASNLMYLRVGNVDMARIGDFSTLYPGLTDPLVFDVVQRMYVTANSNNWAGAVIENDGTGPILDLRNASQAAVAIVHQDGRYEGPAISMGSTTGDKISLYGNYLGTASNYGFGVENNFFYYKSGASGYRWYIGSNADGGTSDYMQLTNAGLSVYGSITPGGYNAADGSPGITKTTNLKGSDGNNCAMTFKNGILTASTCP